MLLCYMIAYSQEHIKIKKEEVKQGRFQKFQTCFSVRPNLNIKTTYTIAINTSSVQIQSVRL